MKTRRSTIQKALALLLSVAVLASLLAACSSGGSSTPSSAGENTGNDTPAVTEERAIHVATNADPGTLDPWSSYSGARNFAIKNVVYELMAVQDGGNFQLVLAKEYSQVEGEPVATYEVTLWDTIYDSAGNHVTADDVIWCYEKHKETGAMQQVGYVDHIDKLDDYRMRVVMTDNTVGRFTSFLTNMPVITKAAWEAAGEDGMSTTPVGTGPYLLTNYTSGSSMSYARNENYWQSPDKITANVQKSNCAAFDITIIKELNQAVVALESGEIDYYCGINYETADRFNSDDPAYAKLSTGTTYSGASEILIMNCSENSVFADNLPLRQVIFHAIDIDAFIAGQTHNTAVKLYDLASPFAADYVDDFESHDYYQYDPELAKELLAEAGYAPGELTLRLMTCPGLVDRQPFAEIVQYYLGEIGINVEILAYENALYEQYKLNPDEWDILDDICGITNVSDFWAKLDSRAYTEETRSACFVDDPVLYEMVADAFDVTKTSEELLMKVHNYIAENAYARGTYAYAQLYACRNDVFKNLEVTSSAVNPIGKAEYVWND